MAQQRRARLAIDDSGVEGPAPGGDGIGGTALLFELTAEVQVRFRERGLQRDRLAIGLRGRDRILQRGMSDAEIEPGDVGERVGPVMRQPAVVDRDHGGRVAGRLQRLGAGQQRGEVCGWRRRQRLNAHAALPSP